MSDRDQIEKLYHDMYAAMIEKDRQGLEFIHHDKFVLVHMTGMQQKKQEYVKAIMNGTLNYFEEQTADIDIEIMNDKAVMTGKSVVQAAVFGGGRNSWKLKLKMNLEKINEDWKLVKAQASTW